MAKRKRSKVEKIVRAATLGVGARMAAKAYQNGSQAARAGVPKTADIEKQVFGAALTAEEIKRRKRR